MKPTPNKPLVSVSAFNLYIASLPLTDCINTGLINHDILCSNYGTLNDANYDADRCMRINYHRSKLVTNIRLTFYDLSS